MLARGNRQAPEVSYAVCDRIGVKPKDLDLLVTNQPNRSVPAELAQALELPKERHRDTFEDQEPVRRGPLINLDRAITEGQLEEG